jgi:hypothetical protein
MFNRKLRAIFFISIVLTTSIFFTFPAYSEGIYVQTIDYTHITHNSSKLHGYLDDGSGTDCTVWFEYGTNNTMQNKTENITTSQFSYFSKDVTDLIAGHIYYYRAVGITDQGYENGTTENFLTKPRSPTNMNIENMSGAGGNAFNISWTMGEGANYSILVYNVSSYPTSIYDGNIIFMGNETNHIVEVEDLLPSKKHYFSVWSQTIWEEESKNYIEYSQTYGSKYENYTILSIKPIVTIMPATNINETSAKLNAELYDGEESCTARFKYGKNTSTTTNTSNQTRETGFINETITNLDKGTLYYYRAYANNSVGEETSSLESFLTKPDKPTDFEIATYSELGISISWTKGTGANTTLIVRKTGNYPNSINDGVIVYNGTGSIFTDENFTGYASQYYRAWSYASEEGLVQISQNTSETFTVNAEFSINFPKYLRTGDYILAWGMISDINGDPIKGFISETKIFDEYGSMVLGPVKWNCSNGNYQAAFSTNELLPGVYDIVVTFENETDVQFTYASRLYLATNPGQGIYVDATVYYTFYDISTGTGLDDNYYKVYLSANQTFTAGDRVKGGNIGVLRNKSMVTNAEYFIQIRDFNNNIIPFSEYNDDLLTSYDQGTIQNAYAGFVVKAAMFYIDLGVYLNQLRIKNMNSSTVYIILKRTDGNPGQVLGRFIPPWEESEVFIPDGMYNLSVHYYDNQHPEYGPIEIAYPWDYTGAGASVEITTDIFYWIQGYRLEDVINVVEREGTWLYYTIFDMNTGTKLEDDFYKVYISKDTTIGEEDRIKGGQFKTELEETLHIQIRDYWNNKIYPVGPEEYENITIVSTKTFIDIGIPLNQLLIKNVNNTLIYFRMTDGNLSDQTNNTWYNRWIPPQESKEIFVRSGTYNISLEYYYPYNAQFIKFENISNYEINKDLFFVIRGYNALVYFNYYNSEQGLGLPFEVLKTYVNGVRIPHEHIQTYIGSTINIVIKDYYNEVMFNQNFSIRNPLTYIDLELTTLSYKFSNYKDSFFVVGFKKQNASVWWERIVCPYETIEFLLPPGTYSVRVYNSTLHLAEFDTVVNASRAFTIAGPDINASLNLVLEGQQKIIAEIRATNETFNYTNSMIFDILGLYYYSNQTIQSIINEFRQPHIWHIPTIEYSVNDTLAPISSITMTVTIDAEIRVTWKTSDNVGVNHTTLYYKVNNATWKEWHLNEGQSGVKYFNESVEKLVEGDVYHFRALGTDLSGNAESPSTINTGFITYQKFTPPSTPEIANFLKDIFSNWLFLLSIIIIIGLVITVIWIEGKKKDKQDKEGAKGKISTKQDNYYESEKQETSPYEYYEEEPTRNPYYGGPYY